MTIATAPVVAAPASLAPVAPPGASPDPAAPPVAPPVAAPPPVAERGPAGEVVVRARSRAGDPLQATNIETFNATQAVDDAVVGPVALAYKKGLPRPIRTGLRNFLNNLREPVVAVNYLFQLKPGKAAETVGRFAVNSTIGVLGLVDMAERKPFRLPYRRNGFANTMGYYGIGPGPFFFLPLIGPTTLRDLLGNGVDQFVPIGPIRPFSGAQYTVPIAILSSLDYRAEMNDELERQRGTGDAYSAARAYYNWRRQAEIDRLKGRPIQPPPGKVLPPKFQDPRPRDQRPPPPEPQPVTDQPPAPDQPPR